MYSFSVGAFAENFLCVPTTQSILIGIFGENFAGIFVIIADVNTRMLLLPFLPPNYSDQKFPNTEESAHCYDEPVPELVLSNTFHSESSEALLIEFWINCFVVVRVAGRRGIINIRKSMDCFQKIKIIFENIFWVRQLGFLENFF